MVPPQASKSSVTVADTLPAIRQGPELALLYPRMGGAAAIKETAAAHDKDRGNDGVENVAGGAGSTVIVCIWLMVRPQGSV